MKITNSDKCLNNFKLSQLNLNDKYEGFCFVHVMSILTKEVQVVHINDRQIAVSVNLLHKIYRLFF